MRMADSQKSTIAIIHLLGIAFAFPLLASRSAYAIGIMLGSYAPWSTTLLDSKFTWHYTMV